jgi:hypothetical protein
MKNFRILIAVASLALVAQTFAGTSPKISASTPEVASASLMYPTIEVCEGTAALTNRTEGAIFVNYVLTVEDAYGRVFTLPRSAMIFAGGIYFDHPFGTVVLGGAITGWTFA